MGWTKLTKKNWKKMRKSEPEVDCYELKVEDGVFYIRAVHLKVGYREYALIGVEGIENLLL